MIRRSKIQAAAVHVLNLHQLRGSVNRILHPVQFHTTPTLQQFIRDSLRVMTMRSVETGEPNGKWTLRVQAACRISRRFGFDSVLATGTVLSALSI
jgi:hypothetical protein